MRPQLTADHRRLLIALVEGEPPEDRGEVRALEAAGRSMHVYQGQVSAALWIRELEYLASLGLIMLRQIADHSWGISPLPAADVEVELLREEIGQPSEGQAAIRRTQRLDARYETFGRRVATVLIGGPVLIGVGRRGG
jgi:hypothetical protein